MNRAINRTQTGRILVVDDSSANLQLLTNLLTEYGHSVFAVSDGDLALEFVSTTVPDLILLDIRMPGMDGFEVCRRLKAETGTRDVPIIFISILEDERNKVRAFKAGAVDYIAKPFQPEEVLARIATHLRLRALTEQQERMVAERTAALRESEAKYRLIVETAREGIWMQGPDALTTFVNPRLSEIFGYSAEEMLGRSMTDFLFVEDVADYSRRLEARRTGGGSETYECRYRHKNGRAVWAQVSIATLFDEEQNFAGVVGMLTDITARRQGAEVNQAHLHFLTCMDRISRAIQETENLEEMMRSVLDVVLAIFDCDQAYLLYPCDPQAKSWTCPMERTKAEYPGAQRLGFQIHLDPEMTEAMRILLDTREPLKAGPGNPYPLPQAVSKEFMVRSVMALSLCPVIGKPWQLGIHQCSRERIWTIEEERIFREIGRRLGDALSMLLIHRDLQASEKRFSTLVNQAADAFFVHDLEGRFLDVNQRACESLGYTREELLSMSVTEVDAEFVSHDHVRNFWSKLAPGHPVTLEGRHKRKDGTTFPVEVRLGLLQLEDRQGILALVRDISERFRMERNLRESEEAFRTLAENSPDNIARYDPECRTLYVNPTLERTLGRSLSELLGSTPTEKPRIAESARYEAMIARVAATGEAAEMDLMFYDLDGGERLHNIRFVAELGPEGGISGVLAIGRDVTERRQAEEEMRILTDELEERVRQRTAELERKNAELERMNQLFVGRELRMIELKTRIKELEGKVSHE